MAVSCAQNGLPAAAAREAQPRRLECPTSLGSRRAPRPGLQEALRSNTEFVFLSAAPRNCALSGSHECAAEQNVIYREYDNSTGGPLTGGRWVLGDGTESWLPRVSWRLGNEEAANGRDEMSQITREHLAKCAETGSASGSASKSRLVLGQSQVGWRFPSAAFSPRLVDRTVWRAARDGLADAPRAGPRLAPGVTPHEPQPSRARAPWGTLGPPPNRVSGKFLFFLGGTVLEVGSRNSPLPGPGTLSVNTLWTWTFFLRSLDGVRAWVEPEDGKSPCPVHGGGTAQWGCWIPLPEGP